MAENALPTSTSELLELIAGEWSALMATVKKLTPDRGGWSPKDNLAHLAHWERYMRFFYLEHRPASEAMGIDAQTLAGLDEDGINALVFERNRARTLQDVLAELERVHAEAVAALAQTPFPRLLEPYSTDDPQKRPILLWVLGNTSGHFAEHRANIERSLE